VTLEPSGRSVVAQVNLWDSAVQIGSSEREHRQHVGQAIEELAKQFVTTWNLDNKGDAIPDGFVAGPAKQELPEGFSAKPSKRTGEYDDLIPKHEPKDPPATVQGPPTEAAQNSEVVIVKYRGPVSLARFKCDAVTRSSFIERVCYDESKSYMLIDLTGTWYHYCEIDSGTVSALLAADSMGGFYNQSIKGQGRFDCRTHRVPQY
jgi:hypothetical protein